MTLIKPTFTPYGVDLQTYEEIYDILVQGYKDIYGSDINVDQDTPDGQRIGIEAIAYKNLQDGIVNILSSLDPETAQGEFLDIISKYWNLTRKPAARGQVDITVVTNTASLLLPAGFVVSDETGTQWTTDNDYILTLGNNIVTCYSDFGDFSALPNTLTKISTPILGVVSVNNSTVSTPGSNEETDLQLRQRWLKAQETSGYSTIGTLLYKLLQVNNVSDVKIYENVTNAFDPVLQLAGHSIWVIVLGGDIQDIINAIGKDKTGGTGLKGSITGVYNEIISYGNINKNVTTQIYFDRPVNFPIFLRVKIKATQGFVDQQLIQNTIAEKVFSIGESILVGSLYSIIFATNESLQVYDLELSRDSTTWTSGILVASADEILNIPISNINITVVP